MAIIIPAILETTVEELNNKMFAITHFLGVSRVQIDFSDGVFTDNQTLSVDSINSLNPAFVWEAHIMCKKPQNFLDYKTLGFSTAIIHAESFDTREELVNALESIKALAMEAIIAVNPETDLKTLIDIREKIAGINLLGVKPGRQGQGQIENFAARVTDAKQLFPDLVIEVDGGVNLDNIHSLVHVADRIVVGSGIFATGDAGENYTKFVQKTQN
jgi:ribulose-phosphate 3-epimerase